MSRVARAIRLALVLISAVLPGIAVGQSEPAIGGYVLVGTLRNGGHELFLYRATLTNPLSHRLDGVRATATSLSPATVLVTRTLQFPAVEPGASVTSLDMFVVQQAAGAPLDPASLTWSITFKTVNSPPAANAGPDQTVGLGARVQLDGSGSTDVDGDVLKFLWRIVSAPAGSRARLSSVVAVRPTFVVDVAGSYIVELRVSDGHVLSAPDTVRISTQNSRPVADAGPPQTVAVGDTVALDGRASSDVDGDPLTFAWTVTERPPGSQATLTDPTASRLAFIADLRGRYLVRLVVNDGFQDSLPATVEIDTRNSAPVADPGQPQTVPAGAAVQLDGSHSSDADGDALTFRWSLTVLPDGSAAALDDLASTRPTFVTDLAGTYVAQLIVNDGQVDSAPATVAVTVEASNRPPVANAGPDQTVARTATVRLDGGASSDPEGTPLSFAWTLLSRPDGSAATLSSPTSANPTFVADRNGTYGARLVVNDGALDSAPDTVTITAQDGADLVLSFFGGPTAPPVGSSATYCINVRDNGPALATGVVARMLLPAGYTVTSSSVNAGSYDATSGLWTIGGMNGPGQVSSANLCVAGTVRDTGPYDVTASVSGNEPDPDSTNNTATITVTPNRNADVSIEFFAAPGAPPVGFQAQFCVQVRANGPAISTGVAAHMLLPAGYSGISAGPNFGTYDAASGTWTIGALNGPGQPNVVTLCVAGTVLPTGPYDVTASVTANEPDPNLANNAVAATVTPNRNADVSIEFFAAPGAPAVGFPAQYCVQVRANGPAISTGVVGHMRLPAGYGDVSASPNFGTYDATSGTWTIGALNGPGQPNVVTLCLSGTVLPTGPYDVTASVSANEPDPNLANNTVTATVTPNRNADVSIGFFAAPSTPAVGLSASYCVEVHANGPARSNGVVAAMRLPAGYGGITSNPNFGTYDVTTGTWTLGTLNAPNLPNFVTLCLNGTVLPTGPYDVAASVTANEPDPNLANNAALAHVTPNPNADLRISFFAPPSGTLAVGASVSFFIEVVNGGPAVTTGITGSFQIPAGYTPTGGGPQVGTYDPATGVWTIGTLTPGSLARLILGGRVNATGPTAITAAITGTSQPDPDLSNNTVTSPPINRPPVADAGPEQHVLTNTTTVLDATRSSDPEGDALTFQWTLTQRPANSVAVLANANTAAPSFLADQVGHYMASLIVTDSHGVASAPASVTITADLGDRAPVITSTPVTAAAIGQPYVYTVTATDPDAGQTLVFSLPTAPAGMAIDGATGLIAWTPATGQGGRQPVTLRVQDPGGLFATQTFVVQVASASEHAPVARDDAYTVRLGEALGVPAPGVLANDTDPDGNALSAQMVSRPANGTVAFNADGSFTYTPFTLTVGELVPLENVNLASRMPGVTFNTDSLNTSLDNFGRPLTPASAFDDDLNTEWRSSFAGTVFGTHPFVEVAFPSSVTVTQLQLFGAHQAPPVLVGTFQLFDGAGNVLFDSGPTELPDPNHDATLNVPAVAGVRRARFTHVLDGGGCCAVGVAELRVIGSAVGQRAPAAPADGNLAQLLPVTVNASGSFGVHIPENVVDDSVGFPSWFADGPSPAFIEIAFPLDVTVTRIETVSASSRPDGFGSSLPLSCQGNFELIDANDTVLFDSGVVNAPCCFLGSSFTLPMSQPVAGVRRARYTNVSCPGSSFPPGFAEFRVFGPSPVTTAPLALARKFQALVGRAAHSTPVVANLRLEDGVPSIIVPVESIGNQLTGEIKVVSGADGRELTTLGTGIVSPWAEVAVGDLDGDGLPDIVALHADGSHLVAFDLAGGTMAGELTALLRPVTVNVSSEHPQFHAPAAVDGNVATPWVLAPTDAAHLGTSPFIEITLRQDVTLTGVELVQEPSFGHFNQGTIQLFAGDGSLVFDTGAVMLANNDFTVPIPSVSGVRRIRFNSTDDTGDPGLQELRAFGSAVVPVGVPRVKWMSDASPMPIFPEGPGLVSAAVSIANLDGGEHPHIIVGAAVFDSNGRLLGDGRSLGGTTGGTGLRSAMPAVADLDLDGRPAIVAGPTAYRLTGGGLTKVWQRADRPDGYVGIANFDDDPRPEIVVVADGFIYMLSHDGSDAPVWNPPTHAPVPIPATAAGAPSAAGQAGPPLIVDVDGDGIPEIGIATSVQYILYNRDGSIRWKTGISDHSSHSTGSVSFDFMGDGEVSIVYRDEQFLRVFRGRDGVLLAKVPLTSSTWAEEPVIVDVDNDGHADVVVVSNNFGSSSPTNSGVHVFQDPANTWRRTRRIWNQSGYHVTNVNEDGSIPRVETPHWLVPGLNTFRTNAFVPGETADAADSFTYVATDGVLQSNVATVRLDVRAPNSAPRITSSPVTTAATGVLYTYAVGASDPDAGDVLTFSLPSAPSGMTIDPASGLVRWTPTAAQLGRQDVTVKVQDARGLFASQAYAVQVAPSVTVPDVVGQPQATAASTLSAATLGVGTVDNRPSATTPAGSVLSQSPAAGALVAPSSAVDIVVASGPPPPGVVPNVVGQVQANAQADVLAAGFLVGTVTTRADDVAPAGVVVSQAPAAGTVAAGGSSVSLVVSLGPAHVPDVRGLTQTAATAAVTAAGFVVGTIADQTSPAVTRGVVIDQAPTGGTAAPLGSSVALIVSLGAGVPGDTTPPTVSIDAPADLAVVTMPTVILGTATDDNFLRYTLELARVDSDAFTTIGTGTSPVVSGVLGRLDPTLLENGLYRVRLTSEDANGQTAVVERVYQVDGMAKVGNFRISFTDLSIPVAGIPITIVRTYDSRVKSREDFGIAWSLDIKRGFYEHNRTPGEAWQILSESFPGLGSLPCRLVSETANHLTQVRLSDYEAYTFALTLSRPATLIGGCEATASFRFIDGRRPGATLEILDGTDVLFLNGGSEVVYPDTFLPYNPARVRLTTADGRVFDLERGAGVTRVQDANDNTLTIGPSGITHSSGKSVAFTRDGEGRIVRITDPNGGTLDYGYDAHGDLASFLDQASNRTTFTYDTRHNLLQVIDPLGRPATRSEYDADGRLVAIIDATGQRRTIAHDLDARQEIVTDRLGHITVVEYDVRGNVVRRTDPLGHVTTTTYDGRDNKLTETDPLGATRRSTYDANDNVLTQTDALGNVTTSTYNTRNQVLTTTDARSGVRAYAYNRRANLVTTTDALGATTTYGYDDRGNRVTSTDPLGNVTTYAYDGSGRLTQTTDPLGAETRRALDANGNLIGQIISRIVNGAVEEITRTFQYDAANRLTSARDGEDAVVRRAYTVTGRLAETIDALGRSTARAYDDLDRLVAVRYADGTSVGLGYDVEGRLTSVTDRAGRATTLDYDAAGRQVTRTNPDGTTVRTSYDAAGRVTLVTDEQGHPVVQSYDAAGRRTGMSDPLGNAVVVDYDANGNLVAVHDALGQTTGYAYDATNRRVRTEQPDGTVRTTAYDVLGRVTRVTDAAGLSTQYTYDARGRMVTVTDALGQTTGYAYDEMGNRVSQTDAAGRITRFTYDRNGRRTARSLPLGQVEIFSYDAAGNLTARTDFRGKTTTYSYDALNRLIGKAPDPSLGEPGVTFAYTPTSQRARMVDASGTTEYTYDARDRLVNKATPQGTLRYTYDPAGNLTSLRSSNPDGVALDYTYDDANRLTVVTDARLAPGTARYAYDANGNVTSVNTPNGVTTTYAYDPLNRVTGLTITQGATTLAGFTYTLGPAGNTLSVVEGTGRTVGYDYDPLYRLTAETIIGDPRPENDGVIGYAYDAVGNRIARTSTVAAVPAVDATYDADDRRAGDTYDANGNTTAAGGATYTYDFEDRLTSRDGGAVTFVYDGDGNRIAKTVNGMTTRYLVDDRNRTGFAQVVEEVSGSLVQRVYGYGRDLLSQRSLSGASLFYGYDGRHNVRLLTDAAGAPVETYRYDAFGTLLSPPPTVDNVYRYSGEQYDPDLDLVYLRARYLDTNTGRFRTRDSYPGALTEPLTLHRYLYAKASPVDIRDPSGQFGLGDALLTTAIVGILAALPHVDLELTINQARTWHASEDVVRVVGDDPGFQALLLSNLGFAFNAPLLANFGLVGSARELAVSLAEGPRIAGVQICLIDPGGPIPKEIACDNIAEQAELVINRALDEGRLSGVRANVISRQYADGTFPHTAVLITVSKTGIETPQELVLDWYATLDPTAPEIVSKDSWCAGKECFVEPGAR